MSTKATPEQQAKLDEERRARERQIKDEYGERAQMVPKYKPNRKQRRAQEAIARQALKERK